MQFTSTLIALVSVLATATATPVVARDAQPSSTTVDCGPPTPTPGQYILGKCQNYPYDGHKNFCPTIPLNTEDPEDYYVIECDPNAQCTAVDNACEWVYGNQYASCT